MFTYRLHLQQSPEDKPGIQTAAVCDNSDPASFFFRPQLYTNCQLLFLREKKSFQKLQILYLQVCRVKQTPAISLRMAEVDSAKVRGLLTSEDVNRAAQERRGYRPK